MVIGMTKAGKNDHWGTLQTSDSVCVCLYICARAYV